MTENADTYFDPDDVGPRDSPMLKPMNIKTRPSPSPEANPPPPVSPDSSPGRRKGGKRSNNRAFQADAVLISFLGGGKRPDIARNAGVEALPSDEDEDEESPIRGTTVEIPGRHLPLVNDDLDITMKMAADAVQCLKAHEDRASLECRNNSQGATGEGITEVSRTFASINANSQAQNNAGSTKNSPRSLETYPGIAPEVNIKLETQPPLPSGELPPMRLSPQSGISNGNGIQQGRLPSISDTLRELAEAVPPPPNEGSFSQSPGRPTPRFGPAPGASPSAKPPNDLRRDMMSPGTPSICFVANDPRRASRSDGSHYIGPGDYSSGSNTETPSTDQSSSTPATATTDQMSIDSITNPQVGAYQCTYPGCNASTFQTQYLLNSHANVHSSSRPHYCTVKDCPRGVGGKGFKRKNEMIRHGLVHDSPGYVCPFCPEREHKYPRPDNLQRHVRVHHPDKDKDDTQLREVLAQRPEGPNRGRRRRGGSGG